MSAANIAPQGAPHKTRHQSDKAWSTTVSLAGVAIAALALLGCYLFWGHEKLLFPLRERESAALDVDGVPELLANAGIAEVRRLPDSRMYVVMKDGTRSRGACLSDGHPVPGPFSSCVSRSMQPGASFLMSLTTVLLRQRCFSTEATRFRRTWIKQHSLRRSAKSFEPPRSSPARYPKASTRRRASRQGGGR